MTSLSFLGGRTVVAVTVAGDVQIMKPVSFTPLHLKRDFILHKSLKFCVLLTYFTKITDVMPKSFRNIHILMVKVDGTFS